MSIKAVVFDWGGTLTPWHDVDLVSQWYAYAVSYDPRNAAALARRLCQSEIARWDEHLETGGAKGPGALDSLFLEEGIDITSARHLRALGAYLDFWAPHTDADPEALPLMAALRHRGILVGVLSNTLWPRAHHQEVFARDGLDGHIDAAVYSSELPVAKPHREAFQAILDALGVTAGEGVFVGDRMWDDVHGAKELGMRAIWIPHSKIPAEQSIETAWTPDAVAHSLADVMGIVERWQGA